MPCVQFATQPLAASSPRGASGLLCANPPYGVRLEDHEAARAVHRELGRVLRERFQGWNAAVLTGAPDLGLELGIRAYRTHTMWNGAIECRLLRLKIDADEFAQLAGQAGAAQIDSSLRDTPGARMFANRLAKNLKRLRGWAREKRSFLLPPLRRRHARVRLCHRLLSNIAQKGKAGCRCRSTRAPTTVDAEGARRRRDEALSVLSEVTEVAAERIRIRTRRSQKRGDQYCKAERAAELPHRARGRT